MGPLILETRGVNTLIPKDPKMCSIEILGHHYNNKHYTGKKSRPIIKKYNSLVVSTQPYSWDDIGLRSANSTLILISSPEKSLPILDIQY